MPNKIVVAGSTGDLGKRIVKSFGAHEANVIALVRDGAKAEDIEQLQKLGATVQVVDMSDPAQVTRACQGADCVVSALAGLHNVIVEAQNILLDGALEAGVPRFIPSDFCTDFTKLQAGENRNFDLRREFHTRLDKAPIASSAIFNGAFAEILMYNIPILSWKTKTIEYWGDPCHPMDFTTMNDTAAYTAAAALDAAAPSVLRIASFQVSANDLLRFTVECLHAPFTLVPLGSLDELRAHNLAARHANPEGENELYPRWQQSQYLQSMFSTRHESLDNDRYEGLKWTSLAEAVRPQA